MQKAELRQVIRDEGTMPLGNVDLEKPEVI